MAETKEKKGFNAALYAVVAGIVVAVAQTTGIYALVISLVLLFANPLMNLL